MDAKEKTVALLSTTNVSFAGNGSTTLYTVPVGKRLVLDSAQVIAGADAGASTTLSIGITAAGTDFVPACTLSNLDAQYDVVRLTPIMNATTLKNKSYAAGAVIIAVVGTYSGGATNSVMLFGTLY